MHGRRLEADLRAVVLAERGGELAVAHLDAVELLQEIDMEIGAAELAVGDPLEADLLLPPDHLADALVLDGAQRRRVDLVGEELLPRLAQGGGTQEAADVIGAERRGHWLLPRRAGLTFAAARAKSRPLRRSFTAWR